MVVCMRVWVCLCMRACVLVCVKMRKNRNGGEEEE